MEVFLEQSDARIVIHLATAAEEACFVYDLIQSGRLMVPNKDTLPLPFRGQFPFKLPTRPRPIDIQVGRFDPTASEALAGAFAVKLVIACPTMAGAIELLPELATALRDVPPASEEEFKSGADDKMDEFTKIRNMTFPQRVIYATRCGQGGRQVLMQQPSPLLMLYVVKNPLITLLEVVAIAKMPSIDALVAEQLVKLMRANPQWAMSEELKLALVTNVKTPGGTALALLRHLNSKSLRKVARMDVNSQLKNACLRILMERKD